VDKLIHRPEASSKKIHAGADFELCYLRHRYFRKTTHNPTPKEMAPYEHIVQNMAKNTFFTYRNLFGMVGFESEDLINTNRVHLVSFLGLFSLESSEHKLKSFEITFHAIHGKYPSTAAILNKNKATFTMFLKQRMEDVVRICRQKAKNIKGLSAEEFHVFYGKNVPPSNLSKLLDNHIKLGFKKLDIASFKSIKKKAKHKANSPFQFGQNWYCSIPVGNKTLSLLDFSSAGLDPHDNMIGMNPEKIYFKNEEDSFWESKQDLFDTYTKEEKIAVMKDFITNKSKDSKYLGEVKTAKKFLRMLKKEEI
jgi:hypothetical protein